MAGSMWPNCLGAVRKADIKCPQQLIVGGGKFLIEQVGQEQEQQEYSQQYVRIEVFMLIVEKLNYANYIIIYSNKDRARLCSTISFAVYR